jgi:hypothetical protein
VTATENDHRRRVLDLLAQGKITVDDADQLLRALGASSPGSEPTAAAEPAGRQDARWVRVTVNKAARDGRPPKQVSIRVPMSLVRGGVRLGAIFPQFTSRDSVGQHFREHGFDVDWSKLDLSQLDTVLQNLDETTIDVDKGKAQIRISYE